MTMNHLEAESFALFPFDDRQRVLAFMLAHNIDPHMTLAIKWDGETVTAYQYTPRTATGRSSPRSPIEPQWNVRNSPHSPKG